MALWGKNELANNSPKFAPALAGQTVNSATQAAMFASGFNGKTAIAGSTFTVNTTSTTLTAATGNTNALYAGLQLYLANGASNTIVTIASVTNTTTAVLTANAGTAIVGGAAVTRVPLGAGANAAAIGVFAVQPGEMAVKNTAPAHAGWVLRKQLPNGRVQTEVLVAMKTITGSDTDGSTF